MTYNKKPTSFFEILQQSIKNYPSNTAVIFEHFKLTFSELDNLSSKYAYLLLEMGLKKGDIVTVIAYNQLELVPLIIGIWKAGGIYLPIDPNYPIQRILSILEDAKPKILLTTEDLKKQLHFFTGTILLVNQALNRTKNCDLPKIQKDDLAYIFFTSGTTGKPKGIMVDHQGLAHATLAYQELHPNKFTALLAGSLSFDPSLLTIIFCLSTGGTICLYDNRDGIDTKNFEKIIQNIQKNSVSLILTTPSFYSKLLEKNIVLPTLKNIDLCGENITKNLIQKHREISPNAFLYNLYGPTEYAIGSTAALIFNPYTKETFEVTIGKGFSCNKCYVLDSSLKETRDYDKGEIHVGGPGLAKGYMHLDDLTNEKFISVLDLEHQATKLYKTGDIGYRLPNENIVFVGRADFQVKVNGHRVELEEIESIINNLSYIEQSIVIESPNFSGETQLIAYFKPKQFCTDEMLKQDLSKELLSYMMPAKFIKIKKFPTTKNGKIDRDSLKDRFK